MTKRVRDFLFIIFITLFIVLTVFISLFASGYKLDLTPPIKFNLLLIKTGMLVVDTVPNGAVVFLDDKTRKSSGLQLHENSYLTTPTKIKNLLPGEYTLKLEKKEYWPAKKLIRIESGQTTFVNNINLFKIDQAIQIFPSLLPNLTLSPNNRYLLSKAVGTILDLKNNQEIAVKATASSRSQWLKSGNILFVDGAMITLGENSILDYKEIIGSDDKNWLWDETNNNLYYQNKNSINRLASGSKISTTIISGENYLDYFLQGEQLFYIVKENSTVLKNYSLREQSVSQKTELPENGDYVFEQSTRQWLSLYDQKNNTLYIFDPKNIDQRKNTIRNVRTWEWLNDEQLIYNNDFEIYLLDLQSNNTTLITRLGEKIEKVLCNKNDRYLIFSTNTSLNVIDLRNDNIITILKAEEISFPVLDEKDDILYFNAKIEEQEGVYKILVR